MTTKAWWKSKTVWFNVLSLGIAVLSIPQWLEVVPASAVPWVGLLVALGNIYLRHLTNKPIGLKGD